MKTFKNTYSCFLLAALVCLSLSIPVYSGQVVSWGNQRFDGRDFASNDFVAIAAGGYHSLALKADGSVAGWGDNRFGQATPPASNDFVEIGAGREHSLALKADGSIVGWGYNKYGQAGPPVGPDYVAIAAGYYHSLALKADGSIVGWGYNNYGQATPPAGTDYVAIAAGDGHSLALKADGSIVAWGYNAWGQATPPDGTDYVTIAAGYYHSLALKADGSIAGWGYNDYGQATPPEGSDFVAVAAGGHHSLGLKVYGTIACWGRNNRGQATPPDGNDFVAIAAGWSLSLAIVELNTPPVAVAGPNQTAYAWIDGIAEVNLDSSASYDDDGDALTYLWSWEIEPNVYEANSVNPIIELPVGQHIIELIVNDGIENSEPNYTTVTVIEPLNSFLRIMPRTINRSNRQRYILAWLSLPAEVTRDDIDDNVPLTLYPGDIEASRQFIFQNNRGGNTHAFILAFFNKQDLMNAVPDNGQVQLEAVGQLVTGRYFFGRRTVRIINPPHRRPWPNYKKDAPTKARSPFD